MFVDPSGYITEKEKLAYQKGELSQDVYNILIDLTDRWEKAETAAAKAEIHGLAEAFRTNQYQYEDLTEQANQQLWENGQLVKSMLDEKSGIVNLAKVGIAWYNLVENNAVWDYKKQPAKWMPTNQNYFMFYDKLISFADYGNINYGYTGTILGLSPKTIYQGAGYVQSGVINKEASQYYGDSEVDYYNVKRGIEWANSIEYNGSIVLPLKLIFKIMGG